MKLSSYHKAKGDRVEFYDPLFSQEQDIVYIAKVFDWTKDYQYEIRAKEIIKGGIGYGLDADNKLSEDIENIYPDYDLYNVKNVAYGFLTRGCPRNCSFCNVSQHQGFISHKVADLDNFWKGQSKIVLLDPNILACKDWEELLTQLVRSDAKVDFSQGLDIRVMTEKKVNLINKLNIEMIHFAWDNYEEHTYDQLKKYRDMLNYDERRLRVYVLTNFNTTKEQDLDRIYRLRQLKYDPYVMIYDKKHANKTTKQMQRWVNNKFIWRSCDNFEQYKKRG